MVGKGAGFCTDNSVIKRLVLTGCILLPHPKVQYEERKTEREWVVSI